MSARAHTDILSDTALTKHAAGTARAFDLDLFIAQSGNAIDSTPMVGRIVLLIAEPRLLLLAPLHLSPRAQLADLFMFSDRFETFTEYERRWSWSAALASQVDSALAQLSIMNKAVATPGISASVYLYVNGAFQRKYYPARRLSADRAPCRARTAPSQNCRGTIEYLQDVLRVFGSSSLHNPQHEQTPDGEAYYHYSRHFNVIGVGRGNTDARMITGAALEYAERWVALARATNTLTSPYAEIGADALSPGNLRGIPVGGRSHPRPTTPSRTSNGCAVGNSPAEASLFAALEVIERDALLLTWYTRSTPPRIRLAEVRNASINELVRLIAVRGYDLAVLDITTDLSVPTIAAVLFGRDPDRLGAFVTAACHINPHYALYSALAEAKSLVPTAERNYRRRKAGHARLESSAGHEAQYLYYGDPERRDHFNFLFENTTELDYAAFIGKYPFSNLTPEDAYQQLCTSAALAGYELVVCDNTPELLRALRIFSARVLIPGTIDLVFGPEPPYIPPQRIRSAANRVSWLNTRGNPRDCPPHPLG
jgi:ribosomal protein S12 methylthiotransferase accessory factor